MTPPSPTSSWKATGFAALAMALGLSMQTTQVFADDAPGVTLLATDPRALTGTSTGAFTIVRRGDSNLSLTIGVDISGTGANGADYTALDSVYTLDPGVLALDVVVNPLVNPGNRGNKTVVLTVQSNASYVIYGSSTACVKITDDLYDVPPPSVSISSPHDGAIFTAPAKVTVTADVSDPDIPVASVSFYANDNFIGRVTNSPYTLTWTNVHAGAYAIFARAADKFGKSAVSAPVDITVSATPVVTLSTDDGATSYFIGQHVQLDANIGDANESIKSVSFYVNGKLVGTSTSAPFTFDWQPPTEGTYTVTAVAVDKNTGKKGTSTALQIVVMPYGGGA